MSARPFPRVSLLVLSYQQRALLDQAVRSAFAQDCPPIEIVLSDDGSTDGSFERLKEHAAAYRGPHRVILRPRNANLGIAGHYNALLAFASGDVLVTAAGDDASTPDRVRRLVDAWDANGRRADLIASHLVDMDSAGGLHEVIRVDELSHWRGLDDWATKRPYVVGASHAFTRRMMKRFGPLIDGLAYEDQAMVFRALAMGGAITVDAPLVHYRRGGASGKPRFASAAEMTRWELRRLDQWRSEALQLIADAQAIGWDERMAALMDAPLRRDRYLRLLLAQPPWRERLQGFREAAPLPLGWRLKKLLASADAGLTFQIKAALRKR